MHSLSLVLLTLTLTLTLSVQASEQRELSLRALKVTTGDEAPRIDGVLDEAFWKRAVVATDFIQAEPDAGEPATQKTEVLVVYTEDTLLIGARLFDTEPDRIVGTEYRRDAFLEAEDSFEIFLDTFRDGRNAFYFATNPVGSRLDGLMSNEGSVLNFEWDGVWDVATLRDASGWTAEFAIPFNTLRFPPDNPEGWGLNFGRRVARTREESYWTFISPEWGFDAKWRASAYGRLRGLGEASPGGRLKLKPYALGGAERDYDESDAAEGTITGGLDAKIALSSALNLDITVNTDFAQVESDQQQVNLTRFSLFFPEKRDFFLENAGLFRIGELTRSYEPPATLLFFSRRIGLSEDGDVIPILGGARLTGKLGGTEIDAFHIVTKDTVLGDEFFPQTGFSAVRVKQDILARSSIGGMFLNKAPAEEGGSTRLAAADLNLAATTNTTINAFFAKSRTPGFNGPDHAASLHAQWVTDAASVYGDYVDIGDDFNSEMGFVPRTGIRKYRAQTFWNPRPAALGIRQIFMRNDHVYVTDRDGNLQSQTNLLGPFILFDNGSLVFGSWDYNAEGLDEPFEIRDDVEIPIGEYRFNRFNAGFNFDQSRRVAPSAFYSDGGFFNGTLRTISVGAATKPHNRVRLGAFYLRNDVSLPVEGGVFTTNLFIFRGIVAFSPRAFVRALIQFNDDSQETLANVLFRYTYRPGSDLFIVYNEDRDTAGASSFPKHRELIIKLTFYTVPF